MAKRERRTSFFTLVIEKLVGLIPDVFWVVYSLPRLISIEARLATTSLITIIILAGLAIIVLAASWLCLLAILFFTLTTLGWHPATAMLMLFLINLLLLMIILLIINKKKKCLFFPATCRQLRKINLQD